MDYRIKSIEFDEEKHKYWFTNSEGEHKELHGITEAIGRLMGKSFPGTDIVKVKTLYGSDLHKEVENYYNNNSGILSSESAKWIVQTLEDFNTNNCELNKQKTECEVMVSDFEGTASKVDVVCHAKDGAYLFDIKTTTHFDRPYCSLQLSVYKKLYEENYGEKVLGMFVLGTKARRLFKILEQDKSKVDKILCMNREKTI